ncbi:helix-turn-helix transcriptional regulator [Paractinoplanes hotanensis]|uniref:AAA family ATPase n=1 Tax=Paractinoplanes hotanensis TaxID=2906497 RepID=A0ABT0Y8D8_9ACTN|nr:AAA family ATPase [Actinoplanes hotanensis]MCM4082299.1 AAA family ATPase [Actinoplanes hotanensis]
MESGVADSFASVHELLGRTRELSVLEDLLNRARAGDSGALVVHGEAGIGKTALIDKVDTSAVQVIRMVGVQSESEFPYAGLHQLLGDLTHLADRLPEPQQAALETALGLRAALPPSPFLVGLAVLGVLAEQATNGPLLCLIDDAQWLDEASRLVLAFTARRLGSEGIALVLVSRSVGPEFEGMAQLEVGRLSETDALAILRRVLREPVDSRILDQFLAEAAGNPLALRELPRALLYTDAGGRAAPLAARIERSLLLQYQSLPEQAHRLLLLAAADPTGDPQLLWRAMRSIGLDAEAVEAVEESGALTIDSRVRFRHPLIRSAVYGAASAAARRRAHAALAGAVENDPDRQVWHLGQATIEPDEQIASELTASAQRARRRGGAAATAVLLERAAALSPAPEDHVRRQLAAARSRLDSGVPTRAAALLDALSADALGERDAAVAARLRAQVAFQLNRDSSVAYDLLAVAQRLSSLDPELARSTYHEAMFTSIFALGLPGSSADHRARWAEVSRTVLDAISEDSTHPVDMLVRGQALVGSGDRGSAIPVFRRAVAGLLDGPYDLIAPQWLGCDCATAVDLWDVRSLRTLTDRHVAVGRAEGLLMSLPLALSFAGTAALVEGRLDDATTLADEIDVLNELTRYPFPRHTRLLTAAWLGDAPATGRLAEQIRSGAVARSDGSVLSIANFAEAILANGLGRYEDAVSAGRAELPHIREVNYSSRIVCELVEAAMRVGDHRLAEQALAELTYLTEPIGGDWALGALAAARALVANGPEAEKFHLEAMERFDRAGLTVYAGRARLAYGEWLRRSRRRIDARVQLRAAHQTLAERGANAFADRASRELAATGETARSRTTEVDEVLTVQELNVARLARDGLSNREIATRLFISVRTVEHHLRGVFQKTGIRSRNELASALQGHPT